eukprot:SM000142S00510  [mRNA]  locus=s142:21905:25217:- [translate_table: standard]
MPPPPPPPPTPPPQRQPSSFDRGRPPGEPLATTAPAAAAAKALRRAGRAVGVAAVGAAALLAIAPALLSSPRGLALAVAVVNRTIPGALEVQEASLGWGKPVRLAGISLRDPAGRVVLAAQAVESRAKLWALATLRAGLGDTEVKSLQADLQLDDQAAVPRLSLALARQDLAPSKLRRQSGPAAEPARRVSFTMNVMAPGGGVVVHDGELMLEGGAAEIVGRCLALDVHLGQLASQQDAAVGRMRAAEGGNGVPFVASMWSDHTHSEAAGILRPWLERKAKLLRPLKAEVDIMDLTPAVGRTFLARINPLLRDVVGAAMEEDGMPDLTLRVTPASMELPAALYAIDIEPMQVGLLVCAERVAVKGDRKKSRVMEKRYFGIIDVFTTKLKCKLSLRRGSLVDALLAHLLLEAQSKPGGGGGGDSDKLLQMQTSRIQAKAEACGRVKCYRVDFLINDAVHILAWGELDWLQGQMDMRVAVPADTMRRYFGMSQIPNNYCLEVPLRGKIEKPQVDWRALGSRVAELVLQQRTGLSALAFPRSAVANSPCPPLSEPLPWEHRKVGI